MGGQHTTALHNKRPLGPGSRPARAPREHRAAPRQRRPSVCSRNLTARRCGVASLFHRALIILQACSPWMSALCAGSSPPAQLPLAQPRRSRSRLEQLEFERPLQIASADPAYNRHKYLRVL